MATKYSINSINGQLGDSDGDIQFDIPPKNFLGKFLTPILFETENPIGNVNDIALICSNEKIGQLQLWNHLAVWNGSIDINEEITYSWKYYDLRVVDLINQSILDLKGGVATEGDNLHKLKTLIDSKVNSISGYNLSEHNFSNADKVKLDNLSNYTGFRGAQTSLANIISSYPTGVINDWAIITNPSGNAYFAIWDGDVNTWVSAGQSPTIPGTNLSYTVSGNTLTIVSDTGNDVVLPLSSITSSGLQSKEDKSKLDGIAPNATENQSDATLKDRANHTGTQLASTISDFVSAVGELITSTLTSFKTTNFLDATSSIQNQLNALSSTSGVKVLARKGTYGTSITGTVSETILEQFTIPAGELINGNIVDIKSHFYTSGTNPFRIRISNINSLSGAIQIGLTPNATNNWTSMSRRLFILNNGIEVYNSTYVTYDDVGIAPNTYYNRTAITIDLTLPIYVFLTGTLTSQYGNNRSIGYTAIKY